MQSTPMTADTELDATTTQETPGSRAEELLATIEELHQQGELRLDRTLFGLADKVRKEAGAAGFHRPDQA